MNTPPLPFIVVASVFLALASLLISIASLTSHSFLRVVLLENGHENNSPIIVHDTINLDGNNYSSLDNDRDNHERFRSLSLPGRDGDFLSLGLFFDGTSIGRNDSNNEPNSSGSFVSRATINGPKDEMFLLAGRLNLTISPSMGLIALVLLGMHALQYKPQLNITKKKKGESKQQHEKFSGNQKSNNSVLDNEEVSMFFSNSGRVAAFFGAMMQILGLTSLFHLSMCNSNTTGCEPEVGAFWSMLSAVCYLFVAILPTLFKISEFRISDMTCNTDSGSVNNGDNAHGDVHDDDDLDSVDLEDGDSDFPSELLLWNNNTSLKTMDTSGEISFYDDASDSCSSTSSNQGDQNGGHAARLQQQYGVNRTNHKKDRPVNNDKVPSILHHIKSKRRDNYGFATRLSNKVRKLCGNNSSYNQMDDLSIASSSYSHHHATSDQYRTNDLEEMDPSINCSMHSDYIMSQQQSNFQPASIRSSPAFDRTVGRESLDRDNSFINRRGIFVASSPQFSIDDDTATHLTSGNEYETKQNENQKQSKSIGQTTPMAATDLGTEENQIFNQTKYAPKSTEPSSPLKSNNSNSSISVEDKDHQARAEFDGKNIGHPTITKELLQPQQDWKKDSTKYVTWNNTIDDDDDDTVKTTNTNNENSSLTRGHHSSQDIIADLELMTAQQVTARTTREKKDFEQKIKS